MDFGIKGLPSKNPNHNSLQLNPKPFQVKIILYVGVDFPENIIGLSIFKVLFLYCLPFCLAVFLILSITIENISQQVISAIISKIFPNKPILEYLDQFNDSIFEYNGTGESNRTDWEPDHDLYDSDDVDRIQTNFKCCGSINYTDFSQSPWGKLNPFHKETTCKCDSNQPP